MLYLILLDYVAPMAEVDRHLDDHRRFLEAHYAAGHFLLSGRKQPRTGGVILARAASREEAMRWITEDPFHRAGVARYELIGWAPSMASEGWMLS